jgi:hypothetical protein
MHDLRRRSGILQRDLVLAELRRIETLQRKWNALTYVERAMIAKATPDLTLFFQPRRLGAQTKACTKSNNAVGVEEPVAG